ncbi:MAG: HIT family protein [bacterium]|nr:HIT family protein [bacterium]
MTCLICTRIELIKKGENPFFVKELKTGYVVLGDHQFFEGYTLFLSKIHARELHDLNQDFKKKFLLEMSKVAEAVFRAFKPINLNYELLGNSDKHLHWHIFPRHTEDPQPTKPVWIIPKSIREHSTPSTKKLEELKKVLLKELK